MMLNCDSGSCQIPTQNLRSKLIPKLLLILTLLHGVPPVLDQFYSELGWTLKTQTIDTIRDGCAFGVFDLWTGQKQQKLPACLPMCLCDLLRTVNLSFRTQINFTVAVHLPGCDFILFVICNLSCLLNLYDCLILLTHFQNITHSWWLIKKMETIAFIPRI